MPELTTSSTGAQAVAQLLATLEKPIVFGLPGGDTCSIFDALVDHDATVDCVLVREESIGTLMAEAYGRLSGRPAIVMAQGAWVLGNGSIGLIEAHTGASPMIVLVDASDGGPYSHHGPYQSGFDGGYGAYDLHGALAAVTKRTFLALDPVQAVQMTQLAVKHAVEGEPGPVAVVFHSRSLGGLDPEDIARIDMDWNYGPLELTATLPALAAAAGAIAVAAQPVILAGNGMRAPQSMAALAAFAQALEIPVATTSGGKGVFPEDHALAAGVIGTFGHDVAHTLVATADVVIAVGTKLSASDTLMEHPALIDTSRQVLVQLDPEPLNIGWTRNVKHALVGRAAELLPRLQDAARGASGAGFSRVAHARADLGYFDLPEPGDTGGRVSPRRLCRLLSENLPDDAIVTCDAGENRIFMLHDYQTRRDQTLLQPNGSGGMGYAIPAALGATYSDPHRLAVAVTGDGGLGMSLHCLLTAIENQRRMLVVVMDNQSLGWVKHGQGDRPILCDFDPFDYAKIASAMGCDGISAATEREVCAGVESAVAAGSGVTVLVVKTSMAESFLSISSAWPEAALTI